MTANIVLVLVFEYPELGGSGFFQSVKDLGGAEWQPQDAYGVAAAPCQRGRAGGPYRGWPTGLGSPERFTWSRPMTLRLAAVLAAGLMLMPAAQAQTYPSKTVTLVVPFPAGGSTDWLSRLLGQKLEQRLKQPFIVENRAGGANVIAATAVAKAEPDGHTLLMTTSTT